MVEAGDQQLHVAWQPPASGDTIASYQIFCEPDASDGGSPFADLSEYAQKITAGTGCTVSNTDEGDSARQRRQLQHRAHRDRHLRQHLGALRNLERQRPAAGRRLLRMVPEQRRQRARLREQRRHHLACADRSRNVFRLEISPRRLLERASRFRARAPHRPGAFRRRTARPRRRRHGLQRPESDDQLRAPAAPLLLRARVRPLQAADRFGERSQRQHALRRHLRRPDPLARAGRVRLGDVARRADRHADGGRLCLGFWQNIGKGRFAAGPDAGQPSADTTLLDIWPMGVHAQLRLDGLADRFRWFPIIPYAKAGLMAALWVVYAGDGSVSRSSRCHRQHRESAGMRRRLDSRLHHRARRRRSRSTRSIRGSPTRPTWISACSALRCSPNTAGPASTDFKMAAR